MISISYRLLVLKPVSQAVTLKGAQRLTGNCSTDIAKNGKGKDKKYKVLVTNSEIAKQALDLIATTCELVICESLPVKRSEVLEKVKGVDGILWATKEQLNSEILNAAGPQVKSISLMASGFNNVDVSELKKRGIPMGHTPGVGNASVADIAIGLAIAASRRFQEGREKIMSSTWETDHIKWMLGRDLSEATIGFFGFGRIAQTIARRLEAFNIGPILYTAKKPASKDVEEEFCTAMVPFEELQTKSDFLFNIVPLNAGTTGVFNADVFARMKDSAVFVNVGRGGTVNHDDLCHALETGKIFAAGVDVMSPEPFPADHPILGLQNFIVTPHLGASTPRTRLKMALLAAKNLLQGLAGEPMIAQVKT